MTNTKQTQDDKTIQPFNCSTIQRVKAYAFTLAETLIVIGIIGVVAALTLPNLNHATGDKETVTRVLKAYSILSEAQDRMIAIYGPMSSWDTNNCRTENDRYFGYCWMKRIGEFLKISKSCNEIGDTEDTTYSSCEQFRIGDFAYYTSVKMFYQLADGITFMFNGDMNVDCDGSISQVNDVCLDAIYVDINGANKGKNKWGNDIFHFLVSNSLGIQPNRGSIGACMRSKDDYNCTWWVLEYGNLDYLKADKEGKCNDNPSIILDGVTNTSCH